MGWSWSLNLLSLSKLYQPREYSEAAVLVPNLAGLAPNSAIHHGEIVVFSRRLIRLNSRPKWWPQLPILSFNHSRVHFTKEHKRDKNKSRQLHFSHKWVGRLR